MNRLILAGLAGVALAATAVPAHAYPTYYYKGGCGFNTLNDTTPDRTLGGPNRWNGVIYAYVVPTDSYGVPLPTATISIKCELHVNGVLTDVALAASGVGAAAGASTFSFEAGPTDSVDMCEHTVINGEEYVACGWVGDPSIPPSEVNLVFHLLDVAVGTANDAVFIPVVDPAVCPLLGGDLAPYDVLLWDCPPYGD